MGCRVRTQQAKLRAPPASARLWGAGRTMGGSPGAEIRSRWHVEARAGGGRGGRGRAEVGGVEHRKRGGEWD